jgi:hypothetical protein
MSDSEDEEYLSWLKDQWEELDKAQPMEEEIPSARADAELILSHGDIEWELSEDEGEPTRRADPEFELGFSIGPVEANISIKAPEGADLNNAAVLLSILGATVFGTLAVAGVCEIAAASTAVTLSLAMPAFLLLTLFGILWVVPRHRSLSD